MITVKDLTAKINFKELYSTESSLKKEISSSDITRPGLEMTGYFDYFQGERLQLFGMKEWSYMMREVGLNRFDLLRKIFAAETPAVILARGLEAPIEMIHAARHRDVTLLQSNEPTSRLSGQIASYLDEVLSPRTSIHGVLMDIFGIGVFIQGTSGIGKSETGLDLVRRGHKLIADDRVDVYKKDAFTVMGEPPTILRNLLEIRGVGIIDVQTLFGTGAVKASSKIDLAIRLENYDQEAQYDRLGENVYSIDLVDVSVPLLKIPVNVGRNLSTIIEAAVSNFSAKQMGYNTTEVFFEHLTQLTQENKEE
ncbi:HPr(Ser) kinase/phosphatase [Lactovum miscens]|uniref:HPr kinase/phosphorylase n=1 Tax=Lactovum miscens TaxID=190387 RepID=A0A841C8I9_9LACT|nr:HPr(Ser) kinase/phosphatase [Lactovum miscens]MBB5888048.1 HPr kinase/phosphorylase [Lactovum miscens]